MQYNVCRKTWQAQFGMLGCPKQLWKLELCWAYSKYGQIHLTIWNYYFMLHSNMDFLMWFLPGDWIKLAYYVKSENRCNALDLVWYRSSIWLRYRFQIFTSSCIVLEEICQFINSFYQQLAILKRLVQPWTVEISHWESKENIKLYASYIALVFNVNNVFSVNFILFNGYVANNKTMQEMYKCQTDSLLCYLWWLRNLKDLAHFGDISFLNYLALCSLINVG